MNTVDKLVEEIKDAVDETKGKPPSREAQIGIVAAKGLAECAETAVASIQATLATVQDQCNEIVDDGNALIEAIRTHSKNFQERVTGFSKLQESIALMNKQIANDVSTFGGG